MDHLCGGFALFISMIAGCVPILGTSQRAQVTVFTTALERILDYSNIAINLPISEETLKKYGWHSLKSSRQYTIDDEPLVANLSKLVNLGPITIPLLKSSIIAVSAGARSSSQFRNAGLICLVIGKIGGKEACDALRSLFLMRSNVYEYQYIRGQAALGLALAGDKDAAELLITIRKKAPYGMEAQYGWIARNIDEALTMLEVEPPETWDRVAVQFISEINSRTPNFKEFAKRLDNSTMRKLAVLGIQSQQSIGIEEIKVRLRDVGLRLCIIILLQTSLQHGVTLNFLQVPPKISRL